MAVVREHSIVRLGTSCHQGGRVCFGSCYVHIFRYARESTEQTVRTVYLQELCQSCHVKANYVLSSLSFSVVTAVQSLELSYACRHQKLTSYMFLYKDSVRTAQQTHTVSIIAIIKNNQLMFYGEIIAVHIKTQMTGNVRKV